MHSRNRCDAAVSRISSEGVNGHDEPVQPRTFLSLPVRRGGLFLPTRRRRWPPAASCPAGCTAAETDPEKSAVELMTPATTAAVERGTRLAGRLSRKTKDRSDREASAATSPSADWPAWPFWPAGSTPRRGPLRRQCRTLHRVHPGQHPGERLHQRGRRQQPRPDVWPRLCHAVSGRKLRHDAPARHSRKAGQGGQL